MFRPQPQLKSPLSQQKVQPRPMPQPMPRPQSQTQSQPKAQTSQMSQVQDDNAPEDWLEPKIYKGSTNF